MVQPATPAPSQPHVSLANFRRIKLGMSVAQVDAIFGIPGKGAACGKDECSWVWQDGFGVVQASFGQFDGKGTGASFVSFAEGEGKQYWLEREK
jgi:hypothetical protein